MASKFPLIRACPKCRQPAPAVGELAVGAEVLQVHQCEHCVDDWEFDGQVFPTAHTFAVNERGDVVPLEESALQDWRNQ